MTSDPKINLNKLRVGVCVVDFTKEDGTSRRMIATRNMSCIPTDMWPKTGELEPVNVHADRVVVWDLEAGQYRSFCLSRLNNIFPVQGATVNPNMGKLTSLIV